MEKKRKPPMSLDELEGRSKEEPIPGPLTYQEGGKKKKALKGFSQVLIGALIAVAISSLVMFRYSAQKQDILIVAEDIRGLDARIAQVESSLPKEIARIDSLVNTMGDYAKSSVLKDYVRKEDLPEFMDSLAEADKLLERALVLILTKQLEDLEEENAP